MLHQEHPLLTILEDFLLLDNFLVIFFWGRLTILVVIFNLQHKYPLYSIYNWYSCETSLMSDISNTLVRNVKVVDKNASSLFNFVKLRILRHEWIQIWKKVAKEKNNLVKTDQSFMKTLHTHGDKIGRITLHPLISKLCNKMVLQIGEFKCLR